MDPLPVAPPRRKRKGNKSSELNSDRLGSNSSNSDLKQQVATSDSEGALGSPEVKLEKSILTPSALQTPPPEMKIESSFATRSAARAKPTRPEPYNPLKKHGKPAEFLGTEVQAHQKTALTRSTSTGNSKLSPSESQKKALSRSKSAGTRENVQKSQTPGKEPAIFDSSRGKKERLKAVQGDQMRSGRSSSTTSKVNVDSRKSFASIPQGNSINSSSNSPKRLTKQVSLKNFKVRPLGPAAGGHDAKYEYVDPKQIRTPRNTETQTNLQFDGLDLSTYYVMDNYILASPIALKPPAPTYAKINPMSVTHNEYAVPLGPGTTKALNSPNGKGTTPLSARQNAKATDNHTHSAKKMTLDDKGDDTKGDIYLNTTHTNSCKPTPSKGTSNYDDDDSVFENFTFGSPTANGIKKTGATQTSIDNQEKYMPMLYETMNTVPIYEFARKKSF